MRRVPPLGGTEHCTPGAGAIAEVTVIEVELAEHAILRAEGLNTLVEGDGPQLRVAVHVVEAPVVDVVDDCILGDGLERLARVLGDKPEDTSPVLGSSMGLARKIFSIHAKEAGHKNLVVLAINTAVPLTGQELPGGRVQRLADGLGRIRLWAHRGTAI